MTADDRGGYYVALKRSYQTRGMTMTKARASQPQYAKLTFADGEVIMTPRDRSIFVMSAEKAIEACRDSIRSRESLERFETEILVPLHQWCAVHASKVRACYIPSPMGHIQVFVVTTSTPFDFGLASEVASLELSLARKGWRIGVSQLPDADDDALATFFNKDGALEVYAQSGPASS